MKTLTKAAACFLIFIASHAHAKFHEINSPNDLDMNILMDIAMTTGYTDHIPHFKQIFDNYKVDTFLEFGCGYSTKFFLDNSKKVISVEFVTNGCGPEWLKYCLKFFEGCHKWMPITYFTGYQGDTSWSKFSFFGTDEVYKAGSYQCSQHKNYALISNAYMVELDTFINGLVTTNKIDVGFVDSGLYLRGDLVTLLFNKVPIIFAHDARCRAIGEIDDVYGYSRIQTPSNYEEIFIPGGMGTMIWIKTDPEFKPLRDAIKSYINASGWDAFYEGH
jgi:hypothetical protein